MSWRITGVSAAPQLLDTYSGAAAAYSLRSLSLAYGGPVVRVRRSSDNAEQDFTAIQVTDGTLTTFCGPGDGFVRTWYDQSENGRHTIQPTNGSQPKIVSSGTLVTHNSNPAIDTAGGKTLYNASSGLNSGNALISFAAYSTPVAAAPDTNTMFLFTVGIFQNLAFFSVSSSTGLLSGEYLVLDIRTSSPGSERLGSTSYRRSANTLVIETAQLLTSGTKVFSNNNEVSLNLSHAGATTSANYTPSAIARNPALTIGGLPQDTINNIIASAAIKISEFIVYNTDQSAARSAITSAMNSQYAAF